MSHRSSRLIAKSSTSLRPLTLVTGMGVLTSIGTGIKSFDLALRETRVGIQKSTAYPELSFPLCCGILPNIPDLKQTTFSQGYSRLLRKASRSILAAVTVATEAAEQAQLYQTNLDRERVGLVIAGANLSHHDQYQTYPRYQKAPAYLSPAYALQFMDSNHLGVLSELLNIQGEGVTVGGASASGNVGLLHGLRMLQSGAADICVVIGALADLSPMSLQAFYNLGALGGHGYENEPEKACRPFDQAHNGFIYGQGAGCLILETAESAQRRGVTALGQVLAASQVLDANHLSNPSCEGEQRAMHKALAEAALIPSDINYINTHGSSSALGDQTELQACQAVFGDQLKKCWVNSTKALTGHCLWSAGIIEAIATLLQLNGNYVHGNPNLDEPIGEANFVGKVTTQTKITTALSNSFGFGGINSSVVFGSVQN